MAFPLQDLSDYEVLMFLERLDDVELLNMCVPPVSKKIQKVSKMDSGLKKRITQVVKFYSTVRNGANHQIYQIQNEAKRISQIGATNATKMREADRIIGFHMESIRSEYRKLFAFVDREGWFDILLIETLVERYRADMLGFANQIFEQRTKRNL